MKTRHLVWLLAVALLCGCKSTRHASLPSAADSSPPPEAVPAPVTVKGNVMNSVVPWSDDLTVAKAIVSAEYLGVRDPVSISVRRHGERFFVSPTWLLLGVVDPWLEPGDVLELHTATLTGTTHDFWQYREIVLQLENARTTHEKR